MRQLVFFLAASGLVWPASSHASDPAICAGAHYLWIDATSASNLEQELRQREIEIEDKKTEIRDVVRYKIIYAHNSEIRELNEKYSSMSFWISNAHLSCERNFDSQPIPSGAIDFFKVDNSRISKILRNDFLEQGILYQEYHDDKNRNVYIIGKIKNNIKLYPIMVKLTKGFYGSITYGMGINMSKENAEVVGIFSGLSNAQ